MSLSTYSKTKDHLTVVPSSFVDAATESVAIGMANALLDQNAALDALLSTKQQVLLALYGKADWPVSGQFFHQPRMQDRSELSEVPSTGVDEAEDMAAEMMAHSVELLDTDFDKLVDLPSSNLFGVIIGDSHNNFLQGDIEDDVIFGRGGDDWISGRWGDDSLYGERGSDLIYGGIGDDSLFGGRGNDFLFGDSDNDNLYGHSGSDTLIGGSGNNFLYGGRNNDLLIGDSFNDHYDGGDGTDTVSFDGTFFSITVDLQNAGAQDTGRGHDTFIDIENLVGGNGNDTFRGTLGGNVLEGGEGNDILDGDWGNDRLFGGDGQDILSGGTGNDILDGGAGDGDRAVFVNSISGVVVDLRLNGVPQNTGEGIDTLIDIEDVKGSKQNDLIHGDIFSNTLSGDEGSDWLWGAGGNDELQGGAGNDFLDGWLGDDFLVGGQGADGFFYSGHFLGTGADTIWDFEDGFDKVFIEAGAVASSFSDITISTNSYGFAVAEFGVGTSITFNEVNPNTIGAEDFIFY